MRYCCQCFRLCFCLNPVCCIVVAVSVSIILGMFFMYTIMTSYYMMFFPSIPIAALEHTGMYDYINDYPVVKRENSQESADHHEDYLYEDSGNTEEDVAVGDIFRNKRNTSASTLETEPWLTTSKGKASKNKLKTGKANLTASVNTSKEFDEEPDFHLSNIIMDSVFSHAERENMTQSLGLCRKGADLKIPSFKVKYFPAEEAVDILNCINDIMKNMTKTQICIKLDDELSAYLKWLVLTGEPKETYKPPRPVVTEDFLFPSTPCATNNTNYDVVNPLQPSKCLIDKGCEEKI